MTTTALARPFAALLCAASLAACASAGAGQLDAGNPGSAGRVGAIALTSTKRVAPPVQDPAPVQHHRFAQPVDPAGPAEPAIVDRAVVRRALAQRRADNFGRFAAYVDRGVFPRNHVTDGMLNVWIDEDGRTCAAATIIRDSGFADLVATTAATSNYIVLADVREGELFAWMLTSGFTQEEIAEIQEPFMGEPGDPRNGRMMPLVAEPAFDAEEDARLRARYAEVTAMLLAGADASLELAVDRLMAHPALLPRLLG